VSERLAAWPAVQAAASMTRPMTMAGHFPVKTTRGFVGDVPQVLRR
jgi:hypothetical protein